MTLNGLLALVAVLIVFNLAFNNLLINLRFYCKMNYVTCGLCVFDCINFAQCHCCLDKPCRDRCFTPWTIVKWILKTLIIVATIVLINQEVKGLEQVEELFTDRGESYIEDEYMTLRTFLIVYAL